jgi:demethylmenaquinone methyltransferase/2-methoxy-6-polyprenyl-1,4-benzoquinol methylase
MRSLAADKAPWEAQGAEKRDAVRTLFAAIAPRYDRLNAILSLFKHHGWRQTAVAKLGLTRGATALDLCCGTGDFMLPLRRAVGREGTVLGVDFCEPMLRLAAPKSFGSLALGDAASLPIASGTVDAVTVGWGIRNVADIDAVHREIVRVLRPGGRFASVDMAVPRNRAIRWIARLVLGRLVPLVGALFGNRQAYAYLPQSTERFWTREELGRSMERAGLVQVVWKDLMLGNVCVFWGEKR